MLFVLKLINETRTRHLNYFRVRTISRRFTEIVAGRILVKRVAT